jgi:hypothetical protein
MTIFKTLHFLCKLRMDPITRLFVPGFVSYKENESVMNTAPVTLTPINGLIVRAPKLI